MDALEPAGFGLYLHWPFCQAKCPYCDFNSHVVTTIDQARWRRAYLAEIDRAGAETQGRVLQTVYFGGGTPSLMEPETVAAILDRIRRTWPMVNDPEITLEANPTTVEAGRFRAYAEAGVNRVSMGLQALNDPDLRRLGRMHSAKEGLAAFQVAQSHFSRTSFDLIYARQDQSLKAWERELAQALDVAGDHLSLYQLTIEPGTVFGERFRKGGLRGLPEEDLSADMYMITNDLCGASGFEAYEVSNYARAGAASRHNQNYWRGGDYVGIGPGAHGRLTLAGKRFATETGLAPAAWLLAVERDGTGEASRDLLSADEMGEEHLLMGLRMSEGLDMTRHARISGRALNPEALRHLSDLGMIEIQYDKLRTTLAGRMVLNQVILALA